MKNRVRASIAILAAVTASLPLAMACAAQQPPAQKVELNIPAQEVGDALNQFGRQSGLIVMMYSSLAQGVKSPPLVGSYTAAQALDHLLATTGLVYEFIDERTVAIRSSKTSSGADFLEGVKGQTGAGGLRLARIGAGAENGSSDGAAQAANTEGEKDDAARDSGEKLQELVVTATKRAVSIQDVALSITAMGKEELENRGVVDMSNVLQSVPGVNYFDSDAFNAAIVIRGITQSIVYQNTGAGPTVSTYFDETPITFAGGNRVGAVDIKFSDIERFEVLRGPQGTTFGDASLSGAVRIIPTAPKLNKFEGNVTGDYSFTGGEGGGNNKINGVINIPLITDKLALRASVFRHENSGWVKGVAGSDPASVALNTAAGSLPYAIDRDHQGANEFVGGRIAALWQVNEDFKLEGSFLRQEIEQNGLTNSTVAPYRNTNTDSHPAQRIYRDYAGEFADSQVDITNLKGQYSLGWGELVSSVSWVDSGTQWSWGQGTKFFLPWNWAAGSDFNSFTAELRLSTNFDGPWQFLGGLYHEKLEGFSAETIYDLGTNPNPKLGEDDYTDDKEQNAVFGEISYDITDTLRLTGGGRYYKYDWTTKVLLEGVYFGLPVNTSDGGSTFVSKDDGTNFKVDLSYRPNSNTIVYALWSQGFRLGRPQPGLPPPICDIDGDGVVDGSNGVTIASTKSLQSDSLENYELGAKFTLLDGRMTIDADVYRDTWSKVPTRFYFDLSRSGGCGVDINVGEAVSTGVEVQSSLQLTRALRIDMGAAYVNAEYSKDAPGINVLEGDRLPNSPRFNGNLSFQYDLDILGRRSYIRADSFYVGTFNDGRLPPPPVDAGGYFMLDAVFGMSIGNVDASVFAENLTDVAKISIQDFGGPLAGTYTRPRTVGLRLRYNF